MVAAVELTWEEPPQEAILRVRHTGPYSDILIELLKNPGKWAKLTREYPKPESAQNAAANIRRGVTKGFTKGEFEAVAHERHVYVMYKGPQDKQPDDDQPGEEHDSGPDRAETAVPHPRSTEGPKIRAWARSQGIELGERGRIPEDIRARYYANGDEPPVDYDQEDEEV